MPSRCPDRWLLDVMYSLVAVLNATFFVAAALMGFGINVTDKIFLALGLFACGGLSLRLRWPALGMIIGVVWGIFNDPPIKGGTVDGQMWEAVSHIRKGCILGLGSGIAAEIIATGARSRREQSTPACSRQDRRVD